MVTSKKAGRGAGCFQPASRLHGGRRASAGRDAVTIYIRSADAPISSDDRDYLRRQLSARRARFGSRVERASVRLEDVNGPRGGVDKRCSIMQCSTPKLTTLPDRSSSKKDLGQSRGVLVKGTGQVLRNRIAQRLRCGAIQ